MERSKSTTKKKSRRHIKYNNSRKLGTATGYDRAKISENVIKAHEIQLVSTGDV